MQTTQGAVFRRVCQQGNVELARQILAAGVDIDAPQDDGCTALWLAAEAGQIATVIMLCEHEANLEAVKQPANVTPLYIACQNGHLAVADVLLMHSANPNTTKANGSTPMHIAAQQGFVDICRLLLRYGAKHSPRNIQGVVPLHLAAYQGQENVVRLLLAAGADHNSESQGKYTIDWAEANGHGRAIRKAIEEVTGQPMAQDDFRGEGIVTVGSRDDFGQGHGHFSSRLGSPNPGTRGTADGISQAHMVTVGMGGASPAPTSHSQPRSAIKQPFMVQLRDVEDEAPQYGSHHTPKSVSVAGSGQPVSGWYVPTFLNQSAALSSPVRQDRSVLNTSGVSGSPYGPYQHRPHRPPTSDGAAGFSATALPLSAVLKREEERHNAFKKRITNNPDAGSHTAMLGDGVGEAFKVKAGAGVREVEDNWLHFKRRLDNQRRFLNSTRGSIPDGWLYSSRAVQGYRAEVEKASTELAKAAEGGRAQRPRPEAKTNNCIGLNEEYLGRLRSFILEGEGAKPPAPPSGLAQADLAMMEGPPSPGQFRGAHDSY